METEKIIARLTAIQEEVDKCEPIKISGKIGSVISLIQEHCNYNEENSHIKTLQSIKKEVPFFSNSNIYGFHLFNSYKDLKDSFTTEIEEIIKDIKAVGLLEKKKESSEISIINNLTQSQQQEQSQQLVVEIFMEAIKDELTGNQQKEIKAILEEEKDIDKAKPKLIDKLKSFGENVLSNIVANVIANPKAWEEFVKVWQR